MTITNIEDNSSIGIKTPVSDPEDRVNPGDPDQQCTENSKAQQSEKEYVEHSTLLDYASRCTASFEEEPFNEVDSLLFSWISYLKIPTDLLPWKILITDERHEDCIFRDRDSCRLSDLIRDEYEAALVRDVNSPEETLAIVKAAARNPRFANIRLCLRREETDKLEGKQFAGITIQVTPDLTYVAFRGTDSTMTGWKEDCRMCLSNPVPAQKLAAEYLTAVGKIFRGRLMVGGHSKGGNLAVYSAANCDPEIQERIQLVFSHDGPGFTKEELMKEGYAKIRSRIRKTAPQFSVFGMMLRQEVEPKIIYSFAHGMNQHNATTWKTEWYSLSEYWYVNRISTHIKNKFNNWVESLTDEEMEIFINWVFDVFEQTGIDTIRDLKDNLMTLLPTFMREFSRLDEEKQKVLMDLLRQFIFASDENADPNAKPITAERPIPENPVEQVAEQIREMVKHPREIQELMRKYADYPEWSGESVKKEESEKVRQNSEAVKSIPNKKHQGLPESIRELMHKYDQLEEECSKNQE